MRTIRFAATCAVATILLAACGSSGSASSSGSAPTSAQIRPQLLTLSEMPAGWASAPNSKDGSSTTDQICSGKLDNSIGGKNAPSAQVTFKAAGSSLIPSELDEAIGYDPTASADFSKAKSILDSCHSGKEQGVTLSIGQMSFPSLGDQSSAWLVSGAESIISISAPIVIVRKGDYVMILTLLGTGSNQTSTLEGIATTAVGKMA
jgi:hypothetical protein